MIWIPIISLAILGASVISINVDDLAELDPAQYGLNCTLNEFVFLYLSCLTEYRPKDAVVDCTPQCDPVDDVIECTNSLESIEEQCLVSLRAAMMDIPEKLRDIFFDAEVLQSCNLEINSVVEYCPRLKPFQFAVWTDWSDYGKCSGTWGSQTEVRTRQCVNELSYDPPELAEPESCEGKASESRTCSEKECTPTTETPVNNNKDNRSAKVWTDWGDYGKCSGTCGSQTEVRTRQCVDKLSYAPPELADPESCEGEASESRTCIDTECTPTTETPVTNRDNSSAKVWTDWSDYDKCSGTCGSQTKVRTRQCVNELSYAPPELADTKSCEGEASESRTCIDKECTPTTETPVTNRDNSSAKGTAAGSVLIALSLFIYSVVLILNF